MCLLSARTLFLKKEREKNEDITIGQLVDKLVAYCSDQVREEACCDLNGGKVAFSSLARISGECSTIHSQPALFLFFFEVEISSRKPISLFWPRSVHSGLAS